MLDMLGAVGVTCLVLKCPLAPVDGPRVVQCCDFRLTWLKVQSVAMETFSVQGWGHSLCVMPAAGRRALSRHTEHGFYERVFVSEPQPLEPVLCAENCGGLKLVWKGGETEKGES